MDLAHDLFCKDSRAVLDLVRDGAVGLGRRELSLLLCSVLFRATGLEWYEQGDVWDRVALERPLPSDVPTSKVTAMAADLRQLMLADITPDGPLLGTDGPLSSAAGWADAFRRAGRTLGTAAREGTLQRGLREVASYAVIFHWNRLGLSARIQSILAHAARNAVLGTPAGPAGGAPADRELAAAAQPVRPFTALDADPDRAVARFPLVLQGRRGCPDLETRVRDVREFADSCHVPSNPDDRIDRASSVFNLSALIAADCGMRALAVDLCERLFEVFRTGWPVSGRTSIASLQPLVNLARLERRAGAADSAFRTLDGINRAVRDGGSALVHGTSVSFDGFIAPDGDRSKVDPWLRTLLRGEGTRALAGAGRWAQAAAHAERYGDAAGELREGRQARIIADVLEGRTGSALTLIDTSVGTEPWTQAVAACLRSYARAKIDRLNSADVTAMLTAVQLARQPTDRATTWFRTRLGLTAVDLSAAVRQDDADLMCAELIDEAERSADAFVARDVLRHPVCLSRMTSAQAGALTALVDGARLDAGSIPRPLLDDLTASVQTAGTVLANSLLALRSLDT
jgi:hypothetical protein